MWILSRYFVQFKRNNHAKSTYYPWTKMSYQKSLCYSKKQPKNITLLLPVLSGLIAIATVDPTEGTPDVAFDFSVNKFDGQSHIIRFQIKNKRRKCFIIFILPALGTITSISINKQTVYKLQGRGERERERVVYMKITTPVACHMQRSYC